MTKYQLLMHNDLIGRKKISPEICDDHGSALHVSQLLAASLVVVFFIFSGFAADAAGKQKGFASPEQAVKAFETALKSNDNNELEAIFGPDAKKLIYSGDPVADKQRREKFIVAYDKKNSLVREGEKMVLIVGEKDWPFPIPLVRKGQQWFFDTKEGEQEILDRRIGENELSTIQTILAIVDAEREFAMRNAENNGPPAYAGKFMSDPGKKNGLYWETREGEKPSPLGELVAEARSGGYTGAGVSKKPMPFHGYYFRMLAKQGKHAPGGAYDYEVKGRQIGGFAVVAYPAEYGNSGVMTFMVNHDGVVYEKDLGKNTAGAAKAMKAFDPDKTWKKVEETHGQ
jgi:hypothetical protein